MIWLGLPPGQNIGTQEDRPERRFMTNKTKNAKGVVRFAWGLYPRLEEVRDEARTYFLEVLTSVCPEVLHSLIDELLPMYQRLAAAPTSGQCSLTGSFVELQDQEPHVAEAVMGWCETHYLIGCVDPEPEWHGPDWYHEAHLSSLWPAIRVHETLRFWSRSIGYDPLLPDLPKWPQAIRLVGRIGGPRKLLLLLPEPDECRTKAEYAQRITTIVECFLRDEVALAKCRADQYDNEKRGPVAHSIKIRAEHFEWLALSQVRGWGVPAIAEWHYRIHMEQVAPDTIRKGVRSVADLIGLRLRRGRPGRPRKFGNLSV
jgi:hypothetical protein